MAKSTSRRIGSKKKPARVAPAREASRRKAVTRAKPAASGKRVAPGKTTKASAKVKWVYRFGNGKAEGRPGMRDLLGGKGANLAEMSNLGLPVPPGFTITTAVCTQFYQSGKSYPKDLKKQDEAALKKLGKLSGKSFGDDKKPLLVSVRSGARASMPGMMDTVL